MTPREELAALRRMAELEAKAKPSQPETISQEPTDDSHSTIGNIAAGALKGASRIGDTLLTPVDALARKAGIENSFIGRTDRGEAVDQFMADRADTDSLAYMGGDIATQIAGTAGAGGVLAKGAGVVAPRAAQLTEALRTAGVSGGGLATRATGAAASGAAQAAMVDPQSAGTGAAVSAAIPVAGKVLPTLGGWAADLIGGIGTHTGGEGLRIAAKSGMAGGKKAADFADNLRGNVPIQDVLDTAKSNLQAMTAAKSAEYRKGMAGVSNDKSVLSFNGIDNAISTAAKVSTFKGQVKNTKAADIQKKIAKEVTKWKALDPAEFHTPEGLDALKQKIGGLVESIPFEDKTARMVGRNIYNSIKSEISKQAPVYTKVMKDYSEASSLITEIEKTLTGRSKTSVDTSIRKLQSLMRNNANTNYGNRLNLAKQLEQQGGNEIMPALAGQSLNSLTPRGLGGAVAGVTGVGGIAAWNPLAIPALALQSPRLMGELAYGTGSAARLVNNPATLGALSRSAPILAVHSKRK